MYTMGYHTPSKRKIWGQGFGQGGLSCPCDTHIYWSVSSSPGYSASDLAPYPCACAAADDSSRAWIPATHTGDLNAVPGSSLAQSCLSGYLRNEPVDQRFLSRHSSLCLSNQFLKTLHLVTSGSLEDIMLIEISQAQKRNITWCHFHVECKSLPQNEVMASRGLGTGGLGHKGISLRSLGYITNYN